MGTHQAFCLYRERDHALNVADSAPSRSNRFWSDVLMIVKVNLSALKNTRGYEYALRFVLGGSATVFTGEITAGL